MRFRDFMLPMAMPAKQALISATNGAFFSHPTRQEHGNILSRSLPEKTLPRNYPADQVPVILMGKQETFPLQQQILIQMEKITGEKGKLNMSENHI